MTDETGTSHWELPLSDWVSASTEQELRAFAVYMAEATAQRAAAATQDYTFILYAIALLPADPSEDTLEDKFRRVCSARNEDLLWRPPSVALRLLFHDAAWLALAALAAFFFWLGTFNHLTSVLAGALLVSAGRAFNSALGAARAQRTKAISCWYARRDIQAWAQAATMAAQYVAGAVLDAAICTADRPGKDVDIQSARVWARCETAHKSKEES